MTCQIGRWYKSAIYSHKFRWRDLPKLLLLFISLHSLHSHIDTDRRPELKAKNPTLALVNIYLEHPVTMCRCPTLFVHFYVPATTFVGKGNEYRKGLKCSDTH